jgi:hypothetical protein
MSKKSNQCRENQSGGGQVVGKAPSGRLHQPPRFMGKSGMPDNQSTNRGKGGK